MNTWPELSQIALPTPVKKALIKHLTEPFQTEAEAKDFWQENSVQLVLSESPIDAVLEYTDPLIEGYTISLLILSDAGEGVYYLTPGEPK